MIFVQCATTEGTVEKKVNDYLRESGANYNYCLIIPGAGCEGCISGAEDIVKSYYKRSDVLYIFTSIESLKMLREKVGNDALSSKNVVIDQDNAFCSNSEKSIYPVLFKIEKGKVTSTSYLSPEDDSLISDFLTYMESNPQIYLDLGSAMGTMDELGSSVCDEIIDSTFYLKLETPEDIVIGNLITVQADERYIYCMDQSWSIYTFDRTGKFMGNISRRGAGPEEYALISEFIPNPEKQEIKVLNYGNNILTYGFDGKFISSLKYPESVSEVANLGNRFVGYVPFFKDKEHLCILDDSLRITDTIYPEREIVTPESMSLIPMIQMRGGANYLSYRLPLDLCSYLLMPNGTVMKDIEVKLGDYAAPIEIETSAEKYQEIAMNGPYVLGLWWKHIGNYIFLSYIHEKGNHNVLYSISKNKFWEDKGEQPKGILVDQKTGTYFWPKWYYENYGICAVEDEESTSLLFVKIK